MLYYSFKSQETSNKKATIIFPNSELIEEKDKIGISHILEHIICKNIEKKKDFLKLENLGYDVNGSTANYMEIYFETKDKFIKRLNLFLKIVFNDRIEYNDFKNQKKIVIEEFLLRKNNNDEKLLKKMNYPIES